MNISKVIEAIEIASASAQNLAFDIKSGRPMSPDAPQNLKSLSDRLQEARAFMLKQDMTCVECGWTGPAVHFNADCCCGSCQNCA